MGFVFFVSVKELREKEFHGGVEFNNITDILQKEQVNPIVCQNMLVELGDDLCEVLIASDPFAESGYVLLYNLYVIKY